MSHRCSGLRRGRFVLGSISIVLLAACGSETEEPTANSAASTAPVTSSAPSPTASATATSGPWTYTDDLNNTVTLPQRPRRIVAYIGAAAVLWDFGFEAIGTMGPIRTEDGAAVPAAGKVDLRKVISVGAEEVNLEQIASLKPDLIVLQKGPSGLDAYPLTEEQLEPVRKIAPIIAIQAYGASAKVSLAAYERAAGALGADLNSTSLVDEKKRLAEAETKMKDALSAKPGLVAMFTYADTDGFYVAKTKDFPDLIAYNELGLEIVEAGGADNYFEKLSWEEADRYKADLIFHDERPTSLQPADLADKYPTWGQLPAVKAVQVGKWNAETVLSPRGLADAISNLTAVIATADADVVS